MLMYIYKQKARMEKNIAFSFHTLVNNSAWNMQIKTREICLEKFMSGSLSGKQTATQHGTRESIRNQWPGVGCGNWNLVGQITSTLTFVVSHIAFTYKIWLTANFDC